LRGAISSEVGYPSLTPERLFNAETQRRREIKKTGFAGSDRDLEWDAARQRDADDADVISPSEYGCRHGRWLAENRISRRLGVEELFRRITAGY
jgi:phage terminase large subunit-like protein